MLSDGTAAVFLSALLNKHDAMKALTVEGRQPLALTAAKRLVSLLFEAQFSTIVALACVVSVWYIILTGTDSAAIHAGIARCGLLALPWGIVWAIRATFLPIPETTKKGGRK